MPEIQIESKLIISKMYNRVNFAYLTLNLHKIHDKMLQKTLFNHFTLTNAIKQLEYKGY